LKDKGPYFMTFPVLQSVLDAGALANEAMRRYNLSAPVRCRLISRGMNDIYELRAGAQRYALKVARAGKSSGPEFGFEQAYAMHLARAGFAVSTPVPLTDGAPFFTLDAPEGPRHVVLMRWLDGAPCSKAMTLNDAHRLGAHLARIHEASLGFNYPVRRPVNTELKIRDRLPVLLEMVGDDRATAAALQRATAGIIARTEAIDAAIVPRGAVHGDFQYANIMTQVDGGLAVFDFSDCGEDFLARDLAAFFWRADFDGVGDKLNPPFVAGYESVRRLSPGERAALPLFRAARHLLITASFAFYVNRVGPIPGFDGNLRYYLSMIRLYCAEAGLG
jgi:Ser/Thr protein kinase RdoA (MazF antagonist)